MFSNQNSLKQTSLKTRLTLLNSITIIGAVLASVAVLFYAFERVIDKEMETSLLNEAQLIARIIDEDNDEYEIARKSGLPMEEVDLEEDIRGFNRIAVIKNEQENKVYYTERLDEKFIASIYAHHPKLAPNTFSYSNINLGEEDDYRFIHYRYQDKEGRVYTISVGNSLRKVAWATQRFFLILVVGAPLICFFSSLIVYFISRQGLKPLDRIIEQAEEIRKDSFSSLPTPAFAPREIVRLTRALNRMLTRLETSFEREKQFSAAASHQLRTPLTALKGGIEVSLTKERLPKEYEEVLSSNLGEVNHLISIIDNLLLLAKLDEDQFHQKNTEEINIKELFAEVEEVVKTMCDESAMAIEMQIENKKPLRIHGQKKLINQALYNIISNACKHSGGKKLTLGAFSSAQKIHISIRDNGKGISKEDLPHLFSRFYRGEDSQNVSGYGLGLAIAKAILRAHGGDIAVESQPGKGTLFTLSFPAA